MKWALEMFLLPPMGLILGVVLGLMTMRWRRRFGLVIASVSVCSLWILATPFVADSLLSALEPRALSEEPDGFKDARAIIVLSANFRGWAPEYRMLTVGDMTLMRLRYGARLHRNTGLPILVTGEPLATTLRDDFNVPVRWIEVEAVDTRESAINSAKILRKDGISCALVVTSAWHMPRVIMAFKAAGFCVVPAPTDFIGAPTLDLQSFIPSVKSLTTSFYFFHEIVGLLFYGAEL